MRNEAMKLALETLEVWKGYMPAVWDKTDEQAITALREALAEQPTPVAKPHEQEPVAHRDDFWCADLTCKKCYSADFRFKHNNSVVNESLTTPAQRTWVGLKNEEIDLLINGRGDEDDEDYVEPTGDGFGLTDSDLVQLVRRSEAKLRSKNEDRN